MKKRLLSFFLAMLTLLSMFPTAMAASSEDAALGEVNIYNGDYELGYLSINGVVRKQKYTYFLYEGNDGQQKESPAYCVNPNTKGVPQTVGPGQSIKYLAEEKSSDPKVVGIISNGYPHRSLGELKLDNKYQAYYATKMALWCYLLPNWNIANLKVAPGLSGSELDIGNRILAAAKDIYKRGTTYNYMLDPKMTVTPDRSTAYPVTINGQPFFQQVFTVWSETWVYDYDVAVSFADPGSVPAGAKIVNLDDQEISAVTTSWTGDGYSGQFKVIYPAGSVQGQSGSVQLSLSASVAQYAAMYAICQEKGKYGELQNYICDLDNNRQMEVAAVSSYNSGEEPPPDETILKIVKLEEGTRLPLEGAVFSVYDPEGRKVGSFSTGPDGTVTIPLTLEGHYTVTEEIPPKYHLLPDETTQHADVEYNKTATLTFTNAPYPDARAIDPDDLPPFDLLCGGFPCQAFSNAGKRKGFADARGALFFEIARLAEARRPAYLLLENVPGLLTHDQGRTFAVILSALDDLGYHVEWTVLNSANFHVPQSRKRLFLICYLDPRCAGKILPVFGTNGKALIQVLGGPQGSRVYDSAGVACTQTAGAGGMGGKTGLYLIPPADPFVDLSAGAPRRTDKARCLTARYGQTTLSTHPRERSGVLLIKEATKKGWKAAYPGDSVDLGYAGSNTRRGRVGHDIAHTLETSSIQGIVERGGRIRRLMPRECFRLQGFEDEQIDKILAITSDAQAYKQAGNGVTVNVIEAIGRRIKAVDEALRKEDAAA